MIFAGDSIFFAGIDNTIRSFNLRKSQLELCLVGHADTITSMALAPKSKDFIISNSMDSTLMMWDIKPFCENPSRLNRCFAGATHNFEKNLLKCSYSSDQQYVTAGSADRTVNVWNA